jgi:hypothetical protein
MCWITFWIFGDGDRVGFLFLGVRTFWGGGFYVLSERIHYALF